MGARPDANPPPAIIATPRTATFTSSAFITLSAVTQRDHHPEAAVRFRCASSPTRLMIAPVAAGCNGTHCRMWCLRVSRRGEVRMKPHAIGRDGDRHRSVAAPVRLGRNHFWLLAGVLGTMIALVLLVFFAQLAQNHP